MDATGGIGHELINCAISSGPGSCYIAQVMSHEMTITGAFESVAAGSMAGAVAKTVIAPLDRIKIIYQVSPERQFRLRQVPGDVATIARKEGVLGLWRGNQAMMIRIVPYAAIQFVTYESLKGHWLYANDSSSLTPLPRFLFGSAAGALSVIATYPLDLVRARYAVSIAAQTPGSYLDTFRSIIRNEGGGAVYRGLLATLLGIVPYAGMSFGTYESLKITILTRNNTKELTPGERLLSGACAGLVAQSCTYPLDIIRRRLQTDGIGGKPRKYKGIMDTLLSTYRGEGFIRGLYKGLAMNWVKGPVAVGVSFTVYDTAREYMARLSTFEDGSPNLVLD